MDRKKTINLTAKLDADLIAAKKNITKINLIVLFCRENYSTIHKDIYPYIQKGLILCKEEQFEKEANILKTYLAFYLLHHEKRKKAIAVCNTIIPGLLKNKSYLEYGLTIIILSQIEWAKGSLENAFNLVNRSLDELKYKRKKNPALVQLHWILGVFYFDLNELNASFHHYNLSHNYCDDNTDSGMSALIKIGLASVYKKKENYTEAANLFEETLKISKANKMWLIESRSYFELGTINHLKKQYKKAYKLIEQSYNIRTKNKAIPASISSLVTMAQINFDRGELDQADKQLSEAMIMSEQKGLKSKIANIYLLYSKITEAQKKFELSLKFLKMYNKLDKEINSSQSSNKNKYFQLNYKAQRAQNENDIQKSLNRKLKKSNDIILQQKERLSVRNKEKEVLLKEIHHRVKNNLQIITSLLSLQSINIEDQKTKNIFSYSQYRINSMALIHEMLYQSDNISKINYSHYLKQLIHNLITSIKGQNNKIKTVIDAPDIFLNIDTAIPLGLMINEIVTNSLKYAFHKIENGILNVKISPLKKKFHYLLEIGDNGPGISNLANKNKANSLGMKLIYSLAQQINGTVERDETKQGTHYKITFEVIKTNN
ncbi:MAG: tetratricopeptide repeat protein [Saprospiraceae bacterium]|nr:tetratricopeptide repeat protein [Saprospiraceae bacterium]